MCFDFIARHVWHIDKCLSLFQHGRSEISTCVQVSIERGNTTMWTTETTMQTRTEMPTAMADLRRISRINSDDFNPFHLCFVLDKFLELTETPVVYPIVHPSASILFTDSLEIFHYNLVAFEFGNNVLADVMIDSSHPTSFSARKLLQKSLTGTSAFRLEFATQVFKFPLDLLNLRRIIEAIVGRDRKIIYSEVNAKNRLRSTVTSINLFGERKEEENPSFSVDTQKAFTDFPILKVVFITIRDIKNKRLSDLKQTQDKNVPFEISISREVELNRSFMNDWFRFYFLDNSTSLFDTGNCKLGRQLLSERFINKGVKFDIIFDFMFPRLIDTELQSFGISFDSSNNFRRCSDFDFSCDSTSHGIVDTESLFKVIGGECVNSSNH